MEIELTKNEGYSLNKKYENNYSLNNLIQVEIEKYHLQISHNAYERKNDEKC